MTDRFPNTTLTTARLVLRPFTEADAADVAAGTADPEIGRWVYFGRTWTVPEAAAWCAGAAREPAAGGSSAWFAITARDSGAFAGLLVVKQADWRHRVADVGYWLAAPARGRGYAVEAVREACRWLFSLGFARITLRAAAANLASILVAERAGFTAEGRLRAANAVPGPSSGQPPEPGDREDLLTFALLAPGVAAGGEPDRFPDTRLSTERLLLRPYTRADEPAVLRTLSDPQAARWLPVPRPYTAALATRWCRDVAHENRISGRGVNWAAVRRAEDGSGDGGGFVGMFSLQRTDWQHRVTEVGYVVEPGMRGHGYGAEAVAAIAHWALAKQGFARVEARAAAGNRASLRVAEQAGFVREGVLSNAGVTAAGRGDLILYAMIAAEVS